MLDNYGILLNISALKTLAIMIMAFCYCVKFAFVIFLNSHINTATQTAHNHNAHKHNAHNNINQFL